MLTENPTWKEKKKEKLLCVKISRRKMGNSVPQIRIVTAEKSRTNYYSNHLCMRNLGIMSLHFTHTGPKPAPAGWVGTSATNSSGLWIDSEGSLGASVKWSRLSSLHTYWATRTLKLCPIHLATPLSLGSIWGKYLISGHQVPKSHSHLNSVWEKGAECPELFSYIKGLMVLV